MVPAAVIASAVAYLQKWPSPLEAPAEQLMQWTPLPLAEFLLMHLGALARPAALLGALAVLMLAGGLAGVLFGVGARGLPGTILGLIPATALMLAVLLLLFPASREEPATWLLVAFLPLLVLLNHRQQHVGGRREFLERSGMVLGGAAVLVSLFSIEPVVQALATRRLFAYRRPAGFQIAGISDLVTPTHRFYVMDKVLQDPIVGPPSWNLRVDGAVRSPLRLDYGGLLKRAAVQRYVTMECVDNPVGGPLMSNALWTGVPLVSLLREAGAAGDTVVFHGMDDYAESTPRADLERVGALVAYAMNGAALPRSHGYPARVIVPGIYGFKSVKWLSRIEVVGGAYDGAWRAHGWTETAQIHTSVRIDVARRTGGAVLLAGVAFAGARGVQAVEARVNGGPWRRATLTRALGADAWVQWAVRFHGAAPAGFQVRAIDAEGNIQTPRVHGAYPDGSTGWATATV